MQLSSDGASKLYSMVFIYSISFFTSYFVINSFREEKDSLNEVFFSTLIFIVCMLAYSLLAYQFIFLRPFGRFIAPGLVILFCKLESWVEGIAILLFAIMITYVLVFIFIS